MAADDMDQNVNRYAIAIFDFSLDRNSANDLGKRTAPRLQFKAPIVVNLTPHDS